MDEMQTSIDTSEKKRLQSLFQDFIEEVAEFYSDCAIVYEKTGIMYRGELIKQYENEKRPFIGRMKDTAKEYIAQISNLPTDFESLLMRVFIDISGLLK